MNRLGLSQTQRFHTKAQELKKRRDDVIDLGAGEPNFPEPHHLLGTSNWDSNPTKPEKHYLQGKEKLRSAISERYRKLYCREVDPDNVLLTHGAKASLYQACQVLFGPGDEVLLPNPGWVSYRAQIQMADASPKPVQGEEKNHYLPTASDFKKAITSDTKGLIINSPCNPTGGTYSPEQEEDILNLASERGLVTISDECYDGFSYDKPSSTVWRENRKDLLVIGSASKNFSMTGWRIGYCIGPEEAIEGMSKFQSVFTDRVCTLAQQGMWQALQETPNLPGSIRDEFRSRRDYMAEALSEIPSVKCPAPPGAFYLFPDVGAVLEDSSTLKDDQELALHLLEEAKVVTVPGSAFGLAGHLRIAYVRDLNQLKEAARRIKSLLQSLDT